MNKLLGFFAVVLMMTVAGCSNSDDRPAGSNDDEPYVPIYPTVNLDAIPYAALSDYTFFKNTLKDLTPADGVLPYDLNSGLFTDYASKKRFIWMPEGVKANYVSDTDMLDFPVGTCLIKNFYYEQAAPGNTQKIIETRLMIMKQDGWVFASYIWNDEQTEAVLNDVPVQKSVQFTHNGQQYDINYQIPSPSQCIACHRKDGAPTAIGPKPQNLFKDYAYADGSMNQLAKWTQHGFLQNAPSSVAASVDWKDQTKSLDLRARSYLDINCAHCHSPGGPCDYTPMDLAFNATADAVNYGFCVAPQDGASGLPYIVSGRDFANSLMPFRMSTNVQSQMMPNIGRTIVDDEAVLLIKQWIDGMAEGCP